MNFVGVMQISLCVVSLATAAILVPIVQYRRYRHMRRHHRQAFDRLGILSPAFLWREDRDAQSLAFAQLVSSAENQTLKDPQLDLLRRHERLIWQTCGLSFALLLISFLAFRTDSNSVWDFLTDLAHY